MTTEFWRRVRDAAVKRLERAEAEHQQELAKMRADHEQWKRNAFRWFIAMLLLQLIPSAFMLWLGWR